MERSSSPFHNSRSLPCYIDMFPSVGHRVIGYFGFPRRSILDGVRKRYGEDRPLVDLDVDNGAPDAGVMPTTTCQIIANIVNNAVWLGDRLAVIVAAVGEDKCDRGRHAAYLLRERGFLVVESRFPPEEFEDRHLVYSVGRGGLTDRVQAIMDTVVRPTPLAGSADDAGFMVAGDRPAGPDTAGERPIVDPTSVAGTDAAGERPEPCEPTHGFWGVPPHDFRIFDAFPPTTHIYGWTRCVEAGRPGDMALECFVEKGVPTVFFTQSFCAKQELAHHLAGKHGGLAIDCHREVNDSIMAKIEAFIRLS